MANFALTGLAGFVAPRHLRAISETKNRLVAALDPHDSVGVVDEYFPQAAFFSDQSRFDRHLEKLRHGPRSERVDVVAVCSPNHVHDAHVRMALRADADALCEKPLVLNPWNLDLLEKLEVESGRRVWTVLQLRVHPELIDLKARIDAEPNRRHHARLTYITSRGAWYRYSWKGDPEKSGGVATNIGIHFFDLLHWLFGSVVGHEVHLSEDERAAGSLELRRADVEWFLSIRAEDLPAELSSTQPTLRSIVVDGREVEFSDGFQDLHTRIYEKTLEGTGFGIAEARPSIQIAHSIRSTSPVPSTHSHPLARRRGADEWAHVR